MKTLVAYTSFTSKITYLLEPLNKVNFDDGIMVSCFSEGEDKPTGTFAVEPELIYALAEIHQDSLYGAEWDVGLTEGEQP